MIVIIIHYNITDYTCKLLVIADGLDR